MKRRIGLILVLAVVLSFFPAACSSEQAAPSLEPEESREAFAPAEPTPEAVGNPSPAPVTKAPAPEIETPAETAPSPEETAPPSETPPPEETALPEADEPEGSTDPLQTAVAATATAGITDQIVLAVDHELTFWEKAEDGSWQRRMETYCGYGKNGLVLAEERIMGSKTTPIGAFPLTLAFGTGEDPGTDMVYRQITPNSYWSEVEDESFNNWVESENPVPGEHLIDYYQYKYAVNIGFNLEDIVYSRGCAIFLHVKSRNSWDTAGCVSLTEEDMLALLRMLREGAYMIIVPDAESIGDY